LKGPESVRGGVRAGGGGKLGAGLEMLKGRRG